MSPSILQRGAANICNASLAALQRGSPGVKETHLVDFCLETHYAVELLMAYGVPPTDASGQVEFVDSIDGQDVGWTLGYMLNHTAEVGLNATGVLVSDDALIGVVSCGAFVLLAGLLASVVLARRVGRCGGSAQGDYEQLN